MDHRGCRRDVTLFGRRLFTLAGGRHEWDTDVMAIPDTCVFCRVDCVRCGFAVDGVALKKVVSRMPVMASSLGVKV